MKKFLLNLLSFLGLAVIIYIVLLLAFVKFIPISLRPNAPYTQASGFMFTRLNDVKKISNIDVLVLGSSHAMQGYDIKVFEQHGVSAFNLGSNGQTPILTEVLLKKYLDSVKPKFVVLDIYPGMFARDGIEAALPFVSIEKPDKITWEMARSLNNIKVYNTLLYSAIAQKTGLKGKYKEKKRIKNKEYYKGFVAYDPEPGKKLGSDKESEASEDLVWDESQVQAFGNVTKMLKERNIKYIMVQAPVTKHAAVFKNEKEIDSFFMSHGTYYNFNKLFPNLQQDSLFMDESHLDKVGAEKYTEALMPIVKREMNNLTLQ